MNSGYFSEWIPRFLQYLKMRNYSAKTLLSYDQTLTRFGHYIWLTRNSRAEITMHSFLKQPLRLETEVEVNAIEITNYLSFLTRSREYHATTLNRILSSLSSFYRFMIMQDILEVNPVPRIDRPRVKDTELTYLKHSQVIRLLRSIPDPRDQLIVRIIYATGVRVSELCSINVEDIDSDDRMIRVKGKGGKIRMVFVDQETLDEIDSIIGNRLSGPLFFG
ncbi:tyrosine-type recombinase/integrase, partial [Methanospirillum sp.]|uniref:tyrosine-type recombinase/integrase n=1 Tax=Methanospirillum sp. TaxID=45200 RepID=UPI00262E92E8